MQQLSGGMGGVGMPDMSTIMQMMGGGGGGGGGGFPGMGGGGGAGDQDSGQGGAGGRGGGIAMVTVYGTISGSGTIEADGAVGQKTNPNNQTVSGFPSSTNKGPFSSFKTPLGQTSAQIPHPTQDERTIFSPF